MNERDGWNNPELKPFREEIEAILGGELDNVSEVCFNNMGTIDEVWQKSKEEA